MSAGRAVSHGQQKRAELLAPLMTNLAMHSPELAGRFECPVCGRTFPPSAIEGPDPEVNIAHVYPKEAGGKLITLTCKSCNGRLNRFDRHIIKAQHFHDVITGKTDTWAKLESAIGNVSTRLRFSSSDEGWSGVHAQVLHEKTNPTELDPFLKALAAKPEKVAGHFIIPTYCRVHYSAALTVSAFLTMFLMFGYEFAHLPAIQDLRGAIAKATEAEKIPSSFCITQTEQQRRQSQLPANVAGIVQVRGSIYLGATISTPSGVEFVGLVLLQGPPAPKGTTSSFEFLLVHANPRIHLTSREATHSLRAVIAQGMTGKLGASQ